MILGTKDFTEALEKLTLMDMYKAASQGIHIVQAEAKMLCPVNDGELRSSIYTDVEWGSEYVRATCYTNKAYAPHVEFGTGPKGQANHAGISPDSTGSYVQSPWWIHESQILRKDAEKYGWFYIDTPQGRFYQCSGQAAQPFMYPALKNNEERIGRVFSKMVKDQI